MANWMQRGEPAEDIAAGDRVRNRYAAIKPAVYARLSTRPGLGYHGTVLEVDGDRARVQWDNGITAPIDVAKLTRDPA